MGQSPLDFGDSLGTKVQKTWGVQSSINKILTYAPNMTRAQASEAAHAIIMGENGLIPSQFNGVALNELKNSSKSGYAGPKTWEHVGLEHFVSSGPWSYRYIAAFKARAENPGPGGSSLDDLLKGTKNHKLKGDVSITLAIWWSLHNQWIQHKLSIGHENAAKIISDDYVTTITQLVKISPLFRPEHFYDQIMIVWKDAQKRSVLPSVVLRERSAVLLNDDKRTYRGQANTNGICLHYNFTKCKHGAKCKFAHFCIYCVTGDGLFDNHPYRTCRELNDGQKPYGGKPYGGKQNRDNQRYQKSGSDRYQNSRSSRTVHWKGKPKSRGKRKYQGN